MVLVLFVAWIMVFFGIIKGIKSSGKIMYFSTSFPYIVLIAFFIRALTLDGAVDGVSYMFNPHVSYFGLYFIKFCLNLKKFFFSQWNRLLKGEVWRDAATQIFFSLGLGYGSIIAYSSYNPPKNNCYKVCSFVLVIIVC